jgi:hypothetical protein
MTVQMDEVRPRKILGKRRCYVRESIGALGEIASAPEGPEQIHDPVDRVHRTVLELLRLVERRVPIGRDGFFQEEWKSFVHGLDPRGEVQ